MLARVSFLSNQGIIKANHKDWDKSLKKCEKNLSTVYLFFQLKEESEEEEDQTGLITPADT